MSDHVWTDDAKATLARLWATGMSAAAIGREMGVSKNAIVGKASRLDLDSRPSPIARNGALSPLRKATPDDEAAIVRMHHNGVGRQTIMGVLRLPEKVIRGIIEAVRPPTVRQVAPPPAPRIVCVAPPKPPAATPAPQRRGATCQWVLGKGRMCDQPATAFRPDGRPAPEGAVWCPECRLKVYVRRTAPMEAMA